MSPFDYFSKIYCINLPDNTARWNNCQTQFKQLSISNRVERIYANPPHADISLPSLKYPRGEIGVSLSQSKALVHAMAVNAENVLIFEDDVVFEPNAIEQLQKCLNELPQNWDIFFLGGNPCEPMTKYSSNLYRTSGFVCANAYAVNKSAMLRLYDDVSNNITLRPYDIMTSNLSKNGNGFASKIPICWQDSGTSVIRGAHRDYKPYLLEQWKKNSPKE